MTPTSLRVVSGLLIELRNYIPKEFARRPRELDSYAKWKATEYRQLLLYTGPFVFRKNLKKQKYYTNFLALHVAFRILSSSELLKHVDYAESLLAHFIRSFAKLYGPEYVSHNVHTLSHLPDDVRKFGILDSFSAFRYENYMKTLKKFIRKPDRPLQQLHRRYTEIQNSFVNLTKPVTGIVKKEEHSDGPLIDFCSDPQFRKIITSNYMLSGKRPNNCCGIGDDNLIVCIENFATTPEGECRIIGRAWTKVGPVYRKPCLSTVVGIYRVDELGPLQSWPFDSVKCKYMLIPYGRRSTAAISLLH